MPEVSSDSSASTPFQLSDHGHHQSSLSNNKMMMLSFLCQKRTTDNMVLPPWRTRMLLLMFALLQNGLAGGIIFGWASIDKTILLAPPEAGGAGLTPHETTLIFSRASSISMMASLILGIVLDNYGPRLCSIIACLIVFVGCHVLAFSQSFTGFAFGACLIAFGGPGIQPSIIHIANIFPQNEYLVMSCLGGSVAISFSVFPVFDLLWNHIDGLSFRTLFVTYSMLVMLLGMGSCLLYPDEPYEQLEDDEESSDQETEFLCRLQPSGDSSDVPAQTARIDQQVARSLLLPSPSDSDCLHHESHIMTVAAGPSLQIEQPLNSFLRKDGRKLLKTESFLASKTLLEKGVTSVPISLKDQPFFNQLFSICYIRALLVFLVTCFAANFYVVSLSTELADLNKFEPSVQHQLTQWFTLLLAMGAVGSVIIGWLIDNVGLEISTALTLILGQLQMIMLVFFGDNYVVLIGSFCAYDMFRQFLYPVFIASLTSRLGFKYFGLLLGIGYATAGIAQLLLASLEEGVQSNCNILKETNENNDVECNDNGHWTLAHIAQFLILGALLIVPIQEHRDKTIQEQKIHQILYDHSRSNNLSYGTGL